MNRRTPKRPFNIHAVLRRIRLEIKQFADAAKWESLNTARAVEAK